MPHRARRMLYMTELLLLILGISLVILGAVGTIWLLWGCNHAR